MRSAVPAALLFTAALAVSCSRPAPLFVEENARAHINVLAGTIGSRPAGTAAADRARAYVIDQLTLYGFTVRVQDVDARRPEIGRTARVSNIIAVLPGQRPEAVGLVSHYDSGFENPGAADAAFGVAVALEAARSLAARAQRRWSLFVIITDAEEAGLMGAAGLTTDREVADRLKGYINLEAVGAGEPFVLFETGPGNGWIVAPWARHAPHPRGGSYSLEIYRRLPNDTDFSILKRMEVPGLNFASVGDSYAYHTARDVPDRLPTRLVRKAGENVVAIAAALDGIDITQRAALDATYFDIGGTIGVSYGPTTAWTIAAAALLFATIAFVRVTGRLIYVGGLLRLLLAAFWAAAALMFAVASMIAVTWALRAAREVYHPWYAHPDRLLLLLTITGLTVAWGVNRLGAWLPPRAHAPRHPALAWALTLPLWIALTVLMLWSAPGAAYLWTLPLLAAGLLLTITPRSNAVAIRAGSLVVLGVTATLWLREAIDLSRFMVAVFGRLAMITPIVVYAAIVTLAGVMIAPPLIAALAPPRPINRPPLVTAVLLVAVAAAGAFAYTAPAYTADQPLRRYARAVQEDGADTALWDVASTEPGLDLEDGAPPGWTIDTSAPAVSVPVGRYAHPFVFRTRGPALGPAPARVGVTRTPVEAGVELAVTVVPEEPGLIVTFVAPPNVTPARSNLPGVVRLGRWRATYVAPRPDGVAWRAAFSTADAAGLDDVRVVIASGRFPGGQGWQQLPPWLPRERTVWTASAIWILTPPPSAAPALDTGPLR